MISRCNWWFPLGFWTKPPVMAISVIMMIPQSVLICLVHLIYGILSNYMSKYTTYFTCHVTRLHTVRYWSLPTLSYSSIYVTNWGCVRVWGANITQWRTKHNPWRYNCLINFRWLDINDYIRPATTGDFIHILHSITLSYNTRRAHGRPLLQILLTTDGLISTTGHSRRRYIQLHNMY